MKFIIASLPRSGSTAVYRVIKYFSAGKIKYEPSFFESGTDRAEVKKEALSHFGCCIGIKHVWDPNGWPFRNPQHISTLETLQHSDELVVPNKIVLGCADRVLFLRRRNSFDRTLSDLWGQQTNIWGHNPSQPHDLEEVKKYKVMVSRHAPTRIDTEVFGWYMRNAERWEDRIVSGIPKNILKTIFYEDLFNEEGISSSEFDAWMQLGKWLGMKIDLFIPEVQSIISPDSKLNSIDVYKRIPNYKELRTEFGGNGFSDVAPAV